MRTVIKWMAEHKLAVGALALVAAWTMIRLWFGSSIELLPEEAYYWTYTQHPALSYYDHPPMLAWMIAAGTALLGNTELGVRVGFIALSVGSSLLIFLLARIWFDTRAGWVAVIMFNLLPVYLGLGLLAFPDGPLVFFWLLTLYAVSRALGANRTDYRILAGDQKVRRQSAAFWVLAGVAFGGAMLSKYTAVLLAPSLVLFLALSPEHRSWLRRPQPWIASAIAAAMFSIVIIWNWQHGWASFAFQSTRTAGAARNLTLHVLMFWVFQLAVLTPFGFALLGWALVHGVRQAWRERKEQWTFAVAFALPLFLLFLAASLKTEVHINWTAPVFLSLVGGAAALLAGQCEQGVAWRRWATVAAAAGVVVGGMALVSLRWGVPRFVTYTHAGGWRELTQQVEAAEHRLARATGQDPFILGADKYNLAAEMSFYSGEPEEQLNQFALGSQGLGFAFWTDLKRWEGHPAVVVVTQPKPALLAELRRHFDRVDEPERVEVPALGTRTRVVHLLNCYGYHPKDREQLAAQP